MWTSCQLSDSLHCCLSKVRTLARARRKIHFYPYKRSSQLHRKQRADCRSIDNAGLKRAHSRSIRTKLHTHRKMRRKEPSIDSAASLKYNREPNPSIATRAHWTCFPKRSPFLYSCSCMRVHVLYVLRRRSPYGRLCRASVAAVSCVPHWPVARVCVTWFAQTQANAKWHKRNTGIWRTAKAICRAIFFRVIVNKRFLHQ